MRFRVILVSWTVGPTSQSKSKLFFLDVDLGIQFRLVNGWFFGRVCTGSVARERECNPVSCILELACTLEMGLRSPRPVAPVPWLQPRAMSFSSLSIARSHACVFENASRDDSVTCPNAAPVLSARPNTSMRGFGKF